MENLLFPAHRAIEPGDLDVARPAPRHALQELPCREALPEVFVLDEVKQTTYVGRQPATREETAICEECLRMCPCEAIGDDGDTQDWSVRSFYSSLPETGERLIGDRCRIDRTHSEKPIQES